MEICIIKSQKKNRYLPFFQNQYLCISDGTKRLGEYLSKRLELYDIVENRKKEIAPNLIKYPIWDIRVLQSQGGCCYFTSCHVIEKNQIKVELYRYQEETKTVEFLYEDKENVLLYASQKKTVIFLLNENYLLIQYMYIRSNEMETYSGFLDFELKLYSIKERKTIPITDAWLLQAGIEQMQMITKNICVIKTGVNLLEEKRYQFLTEQEVHPERIGFFNVQQMISDILLRQKNISMDIIEETRWDKTLLHMHVEEEVLMYSKLSWQEEKEEVIFYHYKEKKVEICERMGISEMDQIADTCIIQSMPYVKRKTEEGISFYNVRKRCSEFSFEKEQHILRMGQGMAVVERIQKKGWFGRERYWCEIYLLPGKEQILREKTKVNDIIIEQERICLFTE